MRKILPAIQLCYQKQSNSITWCLMMAYNVTERIQHWPIFLPHKIIHHSSKTAFKLCVRTWRDMEGLERTWKDLGRTREDIKGLERTWKDLEGLERTRKDLKLLERSSIDLKGLGRPWNDLNVGSVTDRQSDRLTRSLLERHAPLKTKTVNNFLPIT